MVDNGREELNPYTDTHALAGDEVSSTYAGRHISVLESNLVHVDISPLQDELVDKGQPVSFGLGPLGNGVGIALIPANSEDEFIPIDTEGIWRCEVFAWESVIVGQIIYITEDGYLTDQIEFGCHVFGYALQPITLLLDEFEDPIPDDAVIAVKVHWMDFGWWWDWWGNGD